MHFTGMVYRPPVEANTPLLEITYGCSWNKCSFCTMYQDTNFGVSPIEHIKSDLQELQSAYSNKLTRLFVVNGDAFTLPTKQLIAIANLIHDYFPNIETISCYASIRNIKTKSQDELIKLHQLGFNDFYIGLETAYDSALKQMNKGYTQLDEYNELEKLSKAGISYNAIVMFGVAGTNGSKEHITETVNLINKYKPKIILSMSTGIQKGTPLEKMRDNGEYTELTERELIKEELEFLESLDMDDNCYYFGSHPYNLINISGYFKDKESMLNYIQLKVKEIETNNPTVLDKVLRRGSL